MAHPAIQIKQRDFFKRHSTQGSSKATTDTPVQFKFLKVFAFCAVFFRRRLHSFQVKAQASLRHTLGYLDILKFFMSCCSCSETLSAGCYGSIPKPAHFTPLRRQMGCVFVPSVTCSFPVVKIQIKTQPACTGAAEVLRSLK